MELAICAQQQFSRVLGDAIIDALQQEGTVCLASGDTPQRAYQYVAAEYQRRRFPLRATLVGLDEWVGLGQQDEGSCQYAMHHDLYQHLALRPGQLQQFDATHTGEALEHECHRINQLLAERPLRLTLLGIGQNGHLGLNEPGSAFNSLAHISNLSETTIRVAQKYFPTATRLHQGITLGIGNILASEHIIIAASGAHKRNIVQRLLFTPPNENFPATSLKQHANTLLLLDDAVFNVESIL
ncbi:6-phosphogluconolactonase [Kluyvera genomosp. 2]|uniref:6-phosphogluconolactonase n=1 Tax=Kluyvera genomosp. 2 TaxID=2774054 RepID=UPI002FD87219